MNATVRFAEVAGWFNCGPLERVFACKKSTRCDGGGSIKEAKKCGFEGTAKVMSYLNEP